MQNEISHDLFDVLIDFKIWFEIENGEDNLSLIGEKKIELLKAIQNEGSIKAAANTCDIDYKVAWEMIDAANQKFHPKSLAISKRGGGGGTYISPLGVELIVKHNKITSILKSILPNISKGFEITIDNSGTILDLNKEEIFSPSNKNSKKFFLIPLDK